MRAELTGAWRGGRVAAPPSKSMAHRALICAALAQGESRIENIAHSKDIDATAGALRAFGAHISFAGGTALVRGTGGRLCTPQGPVWCCESGSTLRFLIP
ncbi:MAG: 3-phosphoshikimate 1-carboxyvinyltransferase, partial [Ruthenibacterium sp.]